MLWGIVCVMLYAASTAEAGQFQKSMCGPALSDALAVICQGRYASGKRSGAAVLYATSPLPEPQLSERSKRDISHACCTNRCSLSDLLLYCEEGYGNIGPLLRTGAAGLVQGPSEQSSGQNPGAGGSGSSRQEPRRPGDHAAPRRFHLWRNNPGFFFVTPAKLDGLQDASDV